MSRHQRGKTNLDFTEARDGEWQWHQLGHMQVCTSLQTDNHASTVPLSFLQAGCPSCRPTKSVNAPKAKGPNTDLLIIMKQLYIVCVVWCFAGSPSQRHSTIALAQDIFETHQGTHILQVGLFHSFVFFLVAFFSCYL